MSDDTTTQLSFSERLGESFGRLLFMRNPHGFLWVLSTIVHSITANPKMSLWLYVKSFLVSVLLVLVALFFHDVFTSTSIYDRTQSGYFSSLTYNLVKVFAFPLTTFVWIVMCCGYYKGRQNYQFMQRAGIKDEAKPSKNQSEQQNKPS